MRKTVVLLLMVLSIPPTVLAQLRPKPTAAFPSGSPRTTNNDDSCDISLHPAATLLLPSFEVDVNAPQLSAVTTLVTVTNVSNQPQIARFTVWTDRSFPIVTFNVFLTGYDVQPINLYDILVRGFVAPPSGTSSSTPVPTNPTAGSQPAANNANPNITSLVGCASLPGAIPPALLADIQTALTTGNTSTLSGIGNSHTTARGFITIDVVSQCSATQPNSPPYFNEILFDNVLIGDYERLAGFTTDMTAAPLVHIRAIPEGGPAGATPGTNLPFTFYDHYTPTATPKIDRRQPLPSVFAARWIDSASLGGFATTYAIWHEGVTTQTTTNVTANAAVPVTEIVRFDEHENPTVSLSGDANNDNAITVSDVFFLINALFVTNSQVGPSGDANGDSQVTVTDIFYLINYLFTSGPPPGGCSTPPCRAAAPKLPVMARVKANDGTVFPPRFSGSGDLAGWMYLNLSGGCSTCGGARAGSARATVSQNWVTVHTEGQGKYAFDSDAQMLGNGCSVNPGLTSASNPIGPAPKVTP